MAEPFLVGLCLRVPGLSPAEKLTLTLLADFANEQGRAWPSTTTLATHIGITRWHVLRITKRLEELELIDIAHSSGRRSNLYSMQWSRIRALVASSNCDPDVTVAGCPTVTPMSPLHESNCDPDVTVGMGSTVTPMSPLPANGDIQAASTVTPRSHDPLLNPLTVEEELLLPTKSEDPAESFLAFYSQTFSAARGRAYRPGRKDAHLVAELLTIYGREQLEDMTTELFTSTDTWIVESDYAVAVLSHRAEQLASRVSVDTPADAGLWRRIIDMAGSMGMWPRAELEQCLGAAEGVKFTGNTLVVRTHGKHHTTLIKNCYNLAVRDAAARLGYPHIQVEFTSKGGAQMDIVETWAWRRCGSLGLPIVMTAVINGQPSGTQTAACQGAGGSGANIAQLASAPQGRGGR